MIVPGLLVCSSFLKSVCMFIVLKALLISSATVFVRAGGGIWLNHYSTVLFTMCSAIVAAWIIIVISIFTIITLYYYYNYYYLYNYYSFYYYIQF